MPTRSKTAARTVAIPQTKEERARDAAQAMRDYEAERLAVLARTRKLRELRLAKESGAVPVGTGKKSRRTSGTGKP